MNAQNVFDLTTAADSLSVGVDATTGLLVPPVDAVAQPHPATSRRLIGVDVARFIAALAIIWLHSCDSPQFARVKFIALFAVPFFTLASVLLVAQVVRRDSKRSFASYFWLRFNRIYVPFLVWTLLYYFFRDAKRIVLQDRGMLHWDWDMLVSGSVYHLWFLPFIFIVCLLTFVVVRLALRYPAIQGPLVVMFAVAGAATGFASLPSFARLGPAIYLAGQSWRASSAFFWGLSVALIYPRLSRSVWRSQFTIGVGAALLAGSLGIILAPWPQPPAIETLAGLGLLIVALLDWHSRFIQFLARFGTISFAIYLCHLMFVEGFQALAARAGYESLWWLDLSVFTLSAICSVSMAIILSRWAWGRWLLAITTDAPFTWRTTPRTTPLTTPKASRAPLAQPAPFAPSAPIAAPAPRDQSAPVVLTHAGGRIASLDAARLIAIFCIILLHTGESPEIMRINYIGTFGVPFYLFASLYFQARSFRRNPGRQIHQYVFSRAKRLYMPFLAWTGIYILARDLKHILIVHEPPIHTHYYFFWTGSAEHLWFLPFLMIVTVFSAIIARRCIQSPTLRWWVIAICGTIGAIMMIVPRPDWLANPINDDEWVFFLQCWKALPAAFLGIALAWWLAWETKITLFPRALGIAGILLTIATIGDQIVHGYSRLDRTLSGLGWLIASLTAWRGRWVIWMAKLGKHAYGIYLAHILVVEGVQAVAHRIGYGSSLGLDIFTMVAAFIGATAIALTLASSPKTAWLNGD